LIIFVQDQLSVSLFGVKRQMGTSSVILDENDDGIELVCEVDSNPVSFVKIRFRDEVKKRHHRV
jgi:hypothetical protein